MLEERKRKFGLAAGAGPSIVPAIVNVTVLLVADKLDIIMAAFAAPASDPSVMRV